MTISYFDNEKAQLLGFLFCNTIIKSEESEIISQNLANVFIK